MEGVLSTALPSTKLENKFSDKPLSHSVLINLKVENKPENYPKRQQNQPTLKLG